MFAKKKTIKATVVSISEQLHAVQMPISRVSPTPSGASSDVTVISFTDDENNFYNFSVKAEDIAGFKEGMTGELVFKGKKFIDFIR